MTEPVSSSRCLEQEDTLRPVMSPTVESAGDQTESRMTLRSHVRTSGREPKTVTSKSITTTSEQKEVRTIDHLPYETLLAIFKSAAASIVYESRYLIQITWMTHVSHRWREIIVNYSPIWSKIYIYGQNTAFLSMQIERCKGVPLFVSIRPPCPPDIDRITSQSKERMQRAGNLIQEHRNQVTHLKVRTSCRYFRKVFGFVWPNLEECDWADNCLIGDERTHGDICDEELPKLRHLSTDGGFNWPMTVAKNLTTAKLEGQKDLDLAVFTEFLRRNTSLEYLELTNLTIRQSPGHRQEASIDLPHLKELWVKNVACDSALTLLNLPSLKRLSVSSESGEIFRLHSQWPEFCSRLSITNLEATHYNRKNIAIAGFDGSGSRSLYFYLHSPSSRHIVTALFRSPSNHSLSSVTSFSFINDMPEGVITWQQTWAICDLLKYLSRVERIRLCPNRLVTEAVRRLMVHTELCPELRELSVVVPEQVCRATVALVGQMLKARAGGSDGWEMTMIEDIEDPSGVGEDGVEYREVTFHKEGV